MRRYDLLNFTEQAGRRRAEAEQEEEEHRDKLHKSTSEIDLMELKKKEERDKAPKTELCVQASFCVSQACRLLFVLS